MGTQNLTPRPKGLLCTMLALAGVGTASTTFAQSVNVTATGTITGSCNITSGSAISLDIGAVPASDFKQVGDVSRQSPTQNIVISCSGNVGVTMNMTGTRASGTPTPPKSVIDLTGDGSAGVASGVGVQILYDGKATPSTPLDLRTDTPISYTGNTATIPVAARYYATSATVSAGTANTTATLKFTFD